MDNIQKEKNLIDLIRKFRDGQDKFNNSPIFNRVLMCLATGSDPLDIIENLLDVIENMNKDFKDLIEKHNQPIIIKKEKG